MSALHHPDAEPRARSITSRSIRPYWGDVPPPRPAVVDQRAEPGPGPVAGGFGDADGGGRARHGARVDGAARSVLSLVAPVSTEPPEPLDWTPPPRFRDRVLAAVGAPVVVGVVCFALAVAVAVIIALLQPHAPDSEAAAAATPAPDPTAGSVTTESSDAQPAAAEPSAQLLVHVIGKVRSPGVVELPVGSRVQDAIEAAGGATSRAALSALNLARPVVDGEQIVVAKRAAADASVADTGPAGAPPDGAGSAGAMLDLNSADASALEQLPRIGPALAQRIVDWRNAHGRFGSVDQLLQVSGIGTKTLDGFRDRIRV